MSSFFGNYLELFAATEIFIFVFIEITTKIDIIRPVFFSRAKLKNYVVFTVIFGLFSIFGTYIGTMQSSGAITNIRDLAPIVAGLVTGPVVGVTVGLIGGVHRFFLDGLTCVPCSMATVLAGLLAGLIFRFNHGRLLGAVSAMLFGAAVELLHGALVLALVGPFSAAAQIWLENIPQMTIAISLGVGISIVIIKSAKEIADALEKQNPQLGKG
jgi:phosphoserine phosphatase RsbU/P